MKIIKRLTVKDKFNREVTVIYSNEVHSVTVDNWVTTDWYFYKRTNKLAIWSKLYTGQPTWVEFWKKQVDPTIIIKIPS